MDHPVTHYTDPPPDIGDQPVRIMVAFIDGLLRLATTDALNAQPHMVDYVRIDPEDTGAYGRALAQRWNLGTDLIVVEQDMVPSPNQMQALHQCQQPWCSYPYYCGTPRAAYGLGLCRFTAHLQAAWPSLGDQASNDHRGRRYYRHWLGLNERIIDLLNHFGHYVHMHEGMAVHLHEYPVSVVDHG